MQSSQDHRMFEKIFSDWTAAFNRKDLTKSCDLFATEVKANYQGVPAKNYQTICDGFKKIFHSDLKSYQYHFQLHDVYREGNLAALRITWYLEIYEHGQLKSKTEDEGIDIFKRDHQGQWKIVNYIGYQVRDYSPS